MTILEGYSGDADLNDPEKDLTKLDIIVEDIGAVGRGEEFFVILFMDPNIRG